MVDNKCKEHVKCKYSNFQIVNSTSMIGFLDLHYSIPVAWLLRQNCQYKKKKSY